MLLLEYAARHRINSVSPLRLIVRKDEMIIRCFNAAVYQFFLQKGNPVGAACIINGNLFCICKQNISSAVDNVTRFCVNLIVILISTGIKLQQIAFLALIMI